jgi:hypothetical protein
MPADHRRPKRKEEFDDQAWGKEQPRQIRLGCSAIKSSSQDRDPFVESALMRIFLPSREVAKLARIDFMCSACKDVLTVGTIRLAFPLLPMEPSIPDAPLLTRRMAWSHRASRSLLKSVFKY